MTEALLVGLGALLTALIGGIVAILNAIHKNRMEARRATGAERDVLVIRLQEQLARLDRQVEEQSAVIAFCHDAHAESEIALADIYGVMLRYHDFSVRCAAGLAKCGQDPGPVPAPPLRPARRDLRAEVDFAARTAQQDEALVRAVGEASGVEAPRTVKKRKPPLPPDVERLARQREGGEP